MAKLQLADVAGKYNRLSLPKLEGYQRVPGKAGRYKGPDGEVSNRQYKTLQREKYSGVRYTQEQYRDLRKELGKQDESYRQSTLTVYQEFKMAYAHKKKFNKLSEVTKDGRFRQDWESWKIVRHRHGTRASEQRRKILKKMGMLQRVAGKWVYVNPG